jgi:hypothetical protein
MMKNLSLLLPLVLLLGSCRQLFAHLRGHKVGHYYHTRHRHVLLAVDAETVDDSSNKGWIITAHDEDGADYVGSPALFSTSNIDQDQEQERYEIITTLLNRQNEVEDSSSSTSSLSV